MSTFINSARPRKYLGQHFLANSRVTAKILDAAELDLDDFVVEIGPGRGALTRLSLIHI